MKNDNAIVLQQVKIVWGIVSQADQVILRKRNWNQ